MAPFKQKDNPVPEFGFWETPTNEAAKRFYDWLATVSYKEDSSFRLGFNRELDKYYVCMYVKVKDSTGRFGRGHYDPFRSEYILDNYDSSHDGRITLQSAEYIQDYELNDYSAWTPFIKRLILQLELHEVDEWFRVGGRLVNDPHAGSTT